MASFVVTFSGTWNAADLMIGAGTSSVDPRDFLQRLENFCRGAQSGAYSSTMTFGSSATDAVAASSDVTATTSGALGIVVNGTTVSTNFNTSQDQTATDAVGNVNANATVNKLVKATKGVSGHLTITANIPGELGNTCTLTVTGTGASATGGGKLASGAGNNGQPTTYTVG